MRERKTKKLIYKFKSNNFLKLSIKVIKEYKKTVKMNITKKRILFLFLFFIDNYNKKLNKLN